MGKRELIPEPPKPIETLNVEKDEPMADIKTEDDVTMKSEDSELNDPVKDTPPDAKTDEQSQIGEVPLVPKDENDEENIKDKTSLDIQNEIDSKEKEENNEKHEDKKDTPVENPCENTKVLEDSIDVKKSENDVG